MLKDVLVVGACLVVVPLTPVLSICVVVWGHCLMISVFSECAASAIACENKREN